MVVEGRIPLGDALQLVVEVDDDFAQRHVVVDFHAVARNVFLLHQLAALAQTEGHDGADVVGTGDDRSADVGFLDVVDHRDVGHAAGVVHLHDMALLVEYLVRYVGHGGDDVHVELAVQTLLHNLHMEQSEETAAEAETQGQRRFGLEGKRGIVQLELLQRRAEILEVLGLDGIDTGKDHRLHFLETRNGLLARIGNVGDGVAHLDLARSLDARDDVAHVARTQFVARHHVHLQHAHLVGLVFLARIEELHLVALADDTVLYLEVGNDAAEGVEHRVEDQGLERCVLVAFGMGNAFDDGRQNLFHAHARLARCTDNLFALAAQQFHDFVFHLVGHGAGHVTLVDDGDNLQVVLDGHVEVRDGLCLHALRGIHDEQRPFAGRDGARHLVREVHMSRRVDEVQDIFFAFVFIFHLDGMALDGDTAFAFQVHIVQHLSFGDLYGMCKFQQTVCQCRFPVVNVGYDTKVSYILHWIVL